MSIFRKLFGIVKCHDCKCFLYKKDASVVKYISYSYGVANKTIFQYYCETHKKPYDINHNGYGFQKFVPGHYIFVTKEGITFEKDDEVKS